MQLTRLGLLPMQALMALIPLLLSLTVHEYAHAAVARLLCDRTAEQQGRLTLNPIVHADPLGSVLLPFGILLLNALLGGGMQVPFFGYARPTPVNAGAFRRDVSARQGCVLVALAGPAANFVLAGLCAAAWGVAHASMPDQGAVLQPLMRQMVLINVGLCLFNLLPLAPLDGQVLVVNMLSPHNAQRFEAFSQRWALLLMLLVMFFAGPLLLTPIYRLAAMLRHTAGV